MIVVPVKEGENIERALKKFKRKFMSNIVYAFVAFLIIFVTMLVSNYILSVIAKSFYINYNGISFYNIFNKPFNLDLILEFLKNIILYYNPLLPL